jgi:hypothetical protein
MGKPVVQHSIPALKLSSFKTNFAPEDLRLFHRPRTRLPTSKKIKVTPAPIEGSRTNPRFKKQSGTIRRKRELSGTSNRSASVVVFVVCVCGVCGVRGACAWCVCVCVCGARANTRVVGAKCRQGRAGGSCRVSGGTPTGAQQRRHGHKDFELLSVCSPPPSTPHHTSIEIP